VPPRAGEGIAGLLRMLRSVGRPVVAQLALQHARADATRLPPIHRTLGPSITERYRTTMQTRTAAKTLKGASRAKTPSGIAAALLKSTKYQTWLEGAEYDAREEAIDEANAEVSRAMTIAIRSYVEEQLADDDGTLPEDGGELEEVAELLVEHADDNRTGIENS
jgi:hypothetical protein